MDAEAQQLVDAAVTWALDDPSLRSAAETIRQMSHGQPVTAQTVGLALGAWSVNPPAGVAGVQLVALGLVLRACPARPQDLARWIEEGRRQALADVRPPLAS